MAVFLWGWLGTLYLTTRLFPVPGAVVCRMGRKMRPFRSLFAAGRRTLRCSWNPAAANSLATHWAGGCRASPGLSFGEAVGEASLGAAFVSTWQQGRPWLAGPWPHPWVVSAPPLGAQPCSCLLPACLFPSFSDTNTVVGLPRPIHESIRTLKLVS